MSSSTNSRTRPEVRKSSVTSSAPAKRGATQTAVSRRAVRSARRAAERRRRNTWLIGTFTVLVVFALGALLINRIQARNKSVNTGPAYNCATATATVVGPQPAETPPASPPKLDSNVSYQTKAVSYTDDNGLTQSANLQYTVLKEGCGPAVVSGDFVVVYYTGWVQSSSKLFDSSYLHKPSECGGTITNTCGFSIGQQQVISGWDNGIPGMKPGESIRLIIPGPLAYGTAGNSGAGIGPNETLVFDITLVGITSGS